MNEKLTKERIKELERAELKLQALESGGVDNWAFYDEAMDNYNKMIEKEEKIKVLLAEIEEELFEGAYEPSEKGAGFCATTEARENAMKTLIDGLNKLKE